MCWNERMDWRQLPNASIHKTFRLGWPQPGIQDIPGQWESRKLPAKAASEEWGNPPGPYFVNACTSRHPDLFVICWCANTHKKPRIFTCVSLLLYFEMNQQKKVVISPFRNKIYLKWSNQEDLHPWSTQAGEGSPSEEEPFLKIQIQMVSRSLSHVWSHWSLLRTAGSAKEKRDRWMQR